MHRPMLCALALALAPALAHGQEEPKFEYGKKEEVKKVEWKAAAQLGLILTAGNARSTAFSGGLNVSRKAGDNKLSLEGAVAYARSSVVVASDADMNGAIGPGEIVRVASTTTNNWNAKLRYDRFFAERDSAYLSGRIGADKPAGKELMGGGQIGYSRLLLKLGKNEVVGEAGYDFTYESYVAPDVDALSIHSARLYLGWKLDALEGFLADVEALANLNKEKGPPTHDDITAFQDLRVNAKAALTVKILSSFNFRFAVGLRFDNAPAPLPPLKVPFEAGYVPLAEKTDVTAEAALIVSLI